MTLPVALLIAVGTLAAGPNPRLDEAHKHIDEFDYAGALKSLDQAVEQVGNPRQVYLEILELRGVVWGNLNKPAKARSAFISLLTLDPDRKLSGDYPPRVRTPFYEAKEAVAKTGPLKFEVQAPVIADQQISSVGVVVSNDPGKLGRAVRFHLGTSARPIDAPLDANGRASAEVHAIEVKWWAELLGDKEAVLELVGSAQEPHFDTAQPPVAANLTPPPVPPPAQGSLVGQAPEPSSSVLRPVGIGLVAAGVVAGGVGGFFAWQSSDARAQVLNAAKDSTGAITGLTQVQAAELDQRSKSSALVANSLFIGAAALAVTGVVLIAVGGPSDSAQVAVTTSGTSVVLAGRF